MFPHGVVPASFRMARKRVISVFIPPNLRGIKKPQSGALRDQIVGSFLLPALP